MTKVKGRAKPLAFCSQEGTPGSAHPARPWVLLRAWWQSAQAYQAADRQVGAQEQGDGGHELQGVTQQPVLAVLERRLGGLGPEFQERERDDDQQEVDHDEDDDSDYLGRGGGLPGDQNVQRGEVAGTRDADHRADEHGEPEPGLTQHPLRPAVLLLRLLWLPVPGRDWCRPPAVQAARYEQPAGSEQQQAKGPIG